MDERKQRILHAIIQDYIKTAEPVGSRTLAKNYDLGISPATVRNEMSDLEDLGFLEQPHTSAGRIPSAKGYRYYVDSLTEWNGFGEEDAALVRHLWDTHNGELQSFFCEVAKLISHISHNISLFLAPAHDGASIKYIHVLPSDEHRAILVVVTSQGALDNEPLFFIDAVKEEELAYLADAFANIVTDSLIKDITAHYLASLASQIEGNPSTLKVIAEGIYRAIAKRKLFYTVGTTALLEQPEFKDIKKVQPVLSLLEQQDQLNQLLSSNSDSPLEIKIGSEQEGMEEMSIIQAKFKGASDLGTLAILGPTRMEYSRIIGILSYMQEFISSVYENKDITKR